MPSLKPYAFYPEAWHELEAADDWYRQHSPESSLRFLSAVLDGLAALREWPHSWPSYRHGTRRFILNQFPFSIVYLEGATEIAIVAIAHHKRRPGYWRDRL